MLIGIDKIDRLETGMLKVAFSVEIGSATAIWHGPPPLLSHAYVVELEIPERLAWAQTISVVSDSTPSISHSSDETSICGLLESVTDDGICVLRLGKSICMVETKGSAAEPGQMVKLRTRQLHLYHVTV